MTTLNKNILTLLSGNATAQLILALGSVPLARLYTPSQFGVFGIVVTIGMVLSHITTLSLENTFMLARIKARRDIAFTPIAINCLFISFLLIVGGLLFNGYKIKDVEISMFLVFVSILTTITYSAFKVLTQYQISVGEFRKSSTAKFTQAIILISFQLLLFKYNYGLIAGYLVAFIISVFLLMPSLKNIKIPSYARLFYFLRRYKNFPLYHAPASLFAAISSNLALFLLSVQFNSAAVGVYLMAHRIISMPLTYFSTSVGQAYYSEITKDNANIRYVTERLARQSLLFATPLFLVFLIISESAFKILFGEAWSESGKIASTLIPWLFISFIVSPLSYIFPTTGNQKSDLVLTVLIFIFRLSGLLIGGATGDFHVAILAFSFFGSVSMCIYGFFIFKIAGSSNLWGICVTFFPVTGFWSFYWLIRNFPIFDAIFK